MDHERACRCKPDSARHLLAIGNRVSGPLRAHRLHHVHGLTLSFNNLYRSPGSAIHPASSPRALCTRPPLLFLEDNNSLFSWAMSMAQQSMVGSVSILPQADASLDHDGDEPGGKKKTGAIPGQKVKRRKVNHACLYCRRSHMTCDEGRPCQRW
jgi:hypothetical protein